MSEPTVHVHPVEEAEPEAGRGVDHAMGTVEQQEFVAARDEGVAEGAGERIHPDRAFDHTVETDVA